jgi:hypothetical protein
VVEATQNGRRCDLRVIPAHHRLKIRINRDWNMLPEPLMRSKMIVETDVFLHRPMQAPLVQSEPVIKALSLQASNETLADGIRPRRLDWCLDFLDVCTPGDRRE